MDYSFLYLLDLENQFRATENAVVHLHVEYLLDLRNRIAPIFEGELGITFVWKLLVASHVCVVEVSSAESIVSSAKT